MKREKTSTIIFTPHYGKYGKMGKQQKVDVDSKLRSLNVLRSILGTIIFIFLFVLSYLLITVFIIPGIQTEDEEIVQLSEDTQSMPVLELNSDVRYDSTTGLPIYSKEEVLIYANEKRPLSEEYVPELEETLGVSVDYRAAQALRALATAAQTAGFELNLTYGYVNPDLQNELYNQKVSELISQQNYTEVMAREYAKFEMPKAYESDMQTGFCVMLNEDKETFETDPFYSWLVKNCVNYGFVFRYPSDKEDYTFHAADPTVLRYVGTEDALAMRQLAMCLEQYVSHINK